MDKDLYYMFGCCLSLSLLHVGPGPKCFSALLYDQITERKPDYMEALGDLAHTAIYTTKLLKVQHVLHILLMAT